MQTDTAVLCEETSLLWCSLAHSKLLQQNATPARPETGGEGRGKQQQQEKQTTQSRDDGSWIHHGTITEGRRMVWGALEGTLED